MLNFVRFGENTEQPPILIAHGLFGSARNWSVIARRLAQTRRVIVVDMRNHGDSPWFDHHSYPDMAADLAGVIDLVGGPMDVIGHSMGGKAAMMLALTHSHLVRRLLIADIAPVNYEHSQQHLIDAMRGLDLDEIETRRDADEALTAVVDEASTRAFLLQSLNVKSKKWALNLATLEREMAKIVGFPEVSGQFAGPSLFLSGASSHYVQPEHRGTIKALFPNAKQAKIPGAGHWLHAEKPREFEAAIRVFFKDEV